MNSDNANTKVDNQEIVNSTCNDSSELIQESKPTIQNEKKLNLQSNLKTNKGRQISDSEEEEPIQPHKTIPNYMKSTRASIALSRELNTNTKEKTEKSRLRSKMASSTPNQMKSGQIPHFMKLTSATKAAAQPSVETKPHQPVKPIDKSNLPRFMKTTAAYEKQIEKEKPKSKPVIKPVDTSNLPRFMKTTEAYKKQVEKEDVTKSHSVRHIKPIDTNNIPRFMRTTEAYKKQVEKDNSQSVTSPRKMKPLPENYIPSYMRETKATLKRLEKDEVVVKVSPLKTVRPVNINNKPNYMKPTVALEISKKETEKQKEEKGKEMKEKEEKERELEELKQKWEQKREEAAKYYDTV